MKWIETHEQDTAAGLPDYLQRERFLTLFRTVGRQVQALEDALRSVEEGWRFENAVGTQLDGLGNLLVQGRGALSDTEYKLRLRARIRILRGSGTPDELLSLVLLLNPALQLRLTEQYPAGAEFRVSGGALPLPEVHLDLLNQLRPAGVRVLLNYQYTGDGDTLIAYPLAAMPTGTVAIRTGLSTVYNPTEGGMLASSRSVDGT